MYNKTFGQLTKILALLVLNGSTHGCSCKVNLINFRKVELKCLTFYKKENKKCNEGGWLVPTIYMYARHEQSVIYHSVASHHGIKNFYISILDNLFSQNK